MLNNSSHPTRFAKCIFVFALFAFALQFAFTPRAAEQAGFDDPFYLPEVGSAQLRIIKPDLLELSLITTKAPAPARPTQWNFVAANFQFALPSIAKFLVQANGAVIPVKTVGFKRRPLYADFKTRDLRIINQLYLELTTPMAENSAVSVTNPDGGLWSATNVTFSAVHDANRYTPAIHLNQAGYMPAFSKKAMVGFYLGTMGELTPPNLTFKLISTATGLSVYEGNLVARGDTGFTYSPAPSQKVFEADFSAFKTAGEYYILVPGLGTSCAFRIHDGVASAYARAYALGLYHQRCGTNNAFPFTRHIHDNCHFAKAEIPTDSFAAVNVALGKFSADYTNFTRHTAPRLDKVSASLYPFVNTARIDVSGGHHDAGDYSKYTINSAQLIHHLIFAVDNFPGVAALDNLGLPESGDGISDLLQEAKWESDFLAKMQDADGGFYFLVYPRNREYEDNVLPDHGDSQVVFPKTTAATAAAVAALAQSASSPAFKQRYPEAAAQYLLKARAGWDFLMRAFAAHGRDGSYQKINHYGNDFLHDDEVAWAATELFLATGDPAFENELIAHFDPANRNTLAQGWIRMWEGYGASIRSYAFAARSGRISANSLNAVFLGKCQTELATSAEEQLRFSRQTAYGCSFPDPYKLSRNAGWYFPVSGAADLLTANSLAARADYVDAFLLNMNFEAGCNPPNVSYITGLGNKRQRQMTHQYAINDRRILPPSGIPLGSIQRSFQGSLPLYPNSELSNLTFPNDFASSSPFAPYDIWGDAYNVTTEFTIPIQARSLAATAALMAQTSLKDQPWTGANARIELTSTSVQVSNSVTASLISDLDFSGAQLVWEGRNEDPTPTNQFAMTPALVGRYWVEAEAVLPDGRRLFASNEFTSTAIPPTIAATGPAKLRVSGAPGQSFMILGSDDLTSWDTVYTGTFTASPLDWTDENASELTVRYYRVVSGI